MKRRLPGVDRKVYKSLDTVSKERAHDLERMLLSLCGRGRVEPVNAWLGDRVSIHDLSHAHETGRIHELVADLRRHDVPIKQGMDAALAWRAPDVQPSTLERYEASADHVIRIARDTHGEGCTVQQVIIGDFVQRFKAQRLAEGAARQTLNKDLQAVSLLASYAEEQGWIDKRPKITRYKTPDRIRYLEPDQIRLYMAALRRRFRLQFQLLLGTGMRLGETEATRACDVQIGADECRILVSDSKTPTGVRPVFVPTWVADALRENIDGNGLSGTGPLFTIPRRTVQKEHERACGIASIAKYTIHDHRHTAAVHLARSGMPLHLLQQQLGHARIHQTMKYAQFHPEYSDVGDYFDAVGEKFGLAQGSERDVAAAVTERMEEAAKILGLDAEELAQALVRGAIRGASEHGQRTKAKR